MNTIIHIGGAQVVTRDGSNSTVKPTRPAAVKIPIMAPNGKKSRLKHQSVWPRLDKYGFQLSGVVLKKWLEDVSGLDDVWLRRWSDLLEKDGITCTKVRSN